MQQRYIDILYLYVDNALYWPTGDYLSSTYHIIHVKAGSVVPRKGSIATRDVLVDPLYNSKLVTRLINNIMYDGKGGVAQKIVCCVFDIVNENT